VLSPFYFRRKSFEKTHPTFKKNRMNNRFPTKDADIAILPKVLFETATSAK